MARVDLETEWTCEAPLDQVKERLRLFQMRIGMRPSGETDSTLTYKMGSQVATRLVGGWMSKKRWLPTQASVTLEADGPATRASAHIEEAMGFGVLDSKFRRKYEQQFATWMADLRSALQDG